MSETKLRVARSSDLPRLKDLYVEMVCYHATLDARYADEETAREEAETYVEEWRRHARGILLVAELEGTVVGFGFGALQKPHLAVAPVRTGRLDLLAVTAPYRRQGIGLRLAQALLEWFQDQGVQRVYVSTSTRNRTANAFWQRLGFLDFSITRSLDLPSDPFADEIR